MEISSAATAFIHSTARSYRSFRMGEFLGVVDTKNVIDRDVDDHHQYQLVPFLPGGGEDSVAVIAFRQVAPHFGDSPVLAYFDDGFVLPYEGIQNVAVDTRVIVPQFGS